MNQSIESISCNQLYCSLLLLELLTMIRAVNRRFCKRTYAGQRRSEYEQLRHHCFHNQDSSLHGESIVIDLTIPQFSISSRSSLILERFDRGQIGGSDASHMYKAVSINPNLTHRSSLLRLGFCHSWQRLSPQMYQFSFEDILNTIEPVDIEVRACTLNNTYTLAMLARTSTTTTSSHNDATTQQHNIILIQVQEISLLRSNATLNEVIHINKCG